MQNKLKKLFDYQRFENNKELQDIIDSTIMPEGSVLLNDDLLGAVAGGKIEKTASDDKKKIEDK